MAIIRVLDTLTANQIAAGEVIERPASVVKELVENAIDADSKSIVVETRNGGINYIRVSDNGGGIASEFVPTAFLHHATSKISTAVDLESIETLGFRGEALSSIASVSNVCMRTKRAEDEAGTELVISGGKVEKTNEIGCAVGTTVEVSNLFFNIPARRKFLKSERSEGAAIADYISRMILARPDIAFRYVQNDRIIYSSEGSGELKNAVFCVYGGDCIPCLCGVEYDDGYIHISGFVGNEQLTKSNRLSQSFFINKRFIRSQKLSFVLQRAFETRAMVGKFAFTILNIEISSREIDVNVHPNKMDVRFKDESRVDSALYKAVREALNNAPEVRANLISVEPKMYVSNDGITAQDTALASKILNSSYQTKPMKVAEALASVSTGGININDTDIRQSLMKEIQSTSFTDKAEPRQTDEEFIASKPVSMESRAFCQERLTLDSQRYKIVGQLFNCYIVIEQDDNIFFIDQHAAHERQLYERIMSHEQQSYSQQLLLPMVIRLTPVEWDTMMSNLSQFEELGFEIEEFGAYTINIRSVPTIIDISSIGNFILEAIALLDKRNKLTANEMKRSALIHAACRHAIKAGDRLDNMQISALLEVYEQQGAPLTCPHGRPVMVSMSKREFEKLFRRVV